MDIDEFRRQLMQDVNMRSTNEGLATDEAFLEIVTEEYLLSAEYLSDNVIPAFYENVGSRNRKIRIDGYYEDTADDSFAVFLVNYSESPGTLSKTSADAELKKLQYFLEEALNTDLYRDLEPSRPEAGLVDRLRELYNQNTITKFKLFILSNSVKGKTIKSFPKKSINNIPAECILWDIERLYALHSSSDNKEPIEIDFTQYTKRGIPSIEASAARTQNYKSYLCVIPGHVLASIYDTYGSRLLEGNVRAFLSTTRKVNKKIRATILNEPTKFFAYNNGISATALHIDLKNDKNGLLITGAKDFQIINGGQTTASLSHAKNKDHADLENIYVQMKLTLIENMEQDAADRLIHDISRSSNSQNAVSEADFFSTSPFHIEMEKISRRLLAPAVDGAQYETYWFYERARGQYSQEQTVLKTPARKKQFLQKYPKNQVITKTDLAKYRYSWEEKPYFVSRGAQTNFMKFANEICEHWEKDKSIFNERWFKESVSMAILFKEIESIISHASWYTKSYRANIVTYTIAILHYLIKEKFPKNDFDLMTIWNKQSIPKDMYPLLDRIAHKVSDYITDTRRPVMNVTQWCKQEECWKKLKAEISLDIPKYVDKFILSKEEIKAANKASSNLKKFDNEISELEQVITLGEKWKTIAADAKKMNLIPTQKHLQALSKAEKMLQTAIPPTEFQAKLLLEILAELKDNGKVY